MCVTVWCVKEVVEALVEALLSVLLGAIKTLPPSTPSPVKALAVDVRIRLKKYVNKLLLLILVNLSGYYTLRPYHRHV